MLTLNRLEVFIAVAKHLNITRAARALQVGQSAVSHQIERLEENLRVTLIRKKTGYRAYRNGEIRSDRL